MTTSARNVEADPGQGLLRVLLTIAAVWLIFWALIGGVFFAVGGPGDTLIGEARLLCLAVFAPPAVVLTVGLLGSEALSRSARLAGKPARPLTRAIGLERE